jgi:hypothetical protein
VVEHLPSKHRALSLNPPPHPRSPNRRKILCTVLTIYFSTYCVVKLQNIQNDDTFKNSIYQSKQMDNYFIQWQRSTLDSLPFHLNSEIILGDVNVSVGIWPTQHYTSTPFLFLFTYSSEPGKQMFRSPRPVRVPCISLHLQCTRTSSPHSRALPSDSQSF